VKLIHVNNPFLLNSGIALRAEEFIKGHETQKMQTKKALPQISTMLRCHEGGQTYVTLTS